MNVDLISKEILSMKKFDFTANNPENFYFHNPGFTA